MDSGSKLLITFTILDYYGVGFEELVVSLSMTYYEEFLTVQINEPTYYFSIKYKFSYTLDKFRKIYENYY